MSAKSFKRDGNGFKCSTGLSKVAGMTRLLTGDKTTASDYFNRCLATKRMRFTEYVLAHAELKSQ